MEPAGGPGMQAGDGALRQAGTWPVFLALQGTPRRRHPAREYGQPEGMSWGELALLSGGEPWRNCGALLLPSPEPPQMGKDRIGCSPNICTWGVPKGNNVCMQEEGGRQRNFHLEALPKSGGSRHQGCVLGSWSPHGFACIESCRRRPALLAPYLGTTPWPHLAQH